MPRIAATLWTASRAAPEVDSEGTKGDRIAPVAMDADAGGKSRIAEDVAAWHRKAVAWRRQEVARRRSVYEGLYDYLGMKESTKLELIVEPAPWLSNCCFGCRTGAVAVKLTLWSSNCRFGHQIGTVVDEMS